MQVNMVGPQLKQLFETSKRGLIILGENTNVDAGSLAASLVEIFVSYKKEAILVTKQELPEAVKPLVKPEQVKPMVEPKSLVISFDWAKAGLEKVTYKVEGDRFNLVVHSKGKKLTPNDIQYFYQGSEFDLIITIGVKKSEDLLNFGIEEETFSSVPTINIDRSLSNTNFGKINIINENTDSLAALFVNTLNQAEITLPTRAAENLFYGMRAATNNFADVIDPATFEAAAICKRAMIPFLTKEVKKEDKEKGATNEDKAPEEDWLQPKVFRSRGLS